MEGLAACREVCCRRKLTCQLDGLATPAPIEEPSDHFFGYAAGISGGHQHPCYESENERRAGSYSRQNGHLPERPFASDVPCYAECSRR
jgi:hypothetical protein